MYKKSAEKIADKIEQMGVGKAPAAVYKYGAEMLLSSLGGILTVIFLSVLFREPLAGFAYYMVYMIVRSSSGGYHATTHFKCYFLSLFCVLVFFVLLAVIPQKLFLPLALPCSVCALAVIFFMAPVGTPNKPLGEAEVRVYRKRARLILAGTALLLALLFCFGAYKYYFVVTISVSTVAAMLIAGRIAMSRHMKRPDSRDQLNS